MLLYARKTYRTSFDPPLSKNKRKKKCKDDKEDANDGDSGGQFEIIVEIVTRSSKNEKIVLIDIYQ